MSDMTGPVGLARRLRAGLTGILLLSLASCLSSGPRPTVQPQPPNQDPDVPELEIGGSLDRDLITRDIRRIPVDDDATYEVDIHNLAPYSREVLYRPVWIDAGGQSFGTREEWLMRELSAFEVVTLRFRAPVTAQSFRLEIAKRREQRRPGR